MKFKILFYGILMAVLITPSAAEYLIFNSYTHTVELREKNSFHEITVAINASQTLNEFTLNLPPRTENLEIQINEKEVSCVLEKKNGLSVLKCPVPDNVARRHFISIAYNTDYPVFEFQDRIMYRSEYIPTNRTARFTYILKLPVGFIIPREKDTSFFINPKPRALYSDGQRIILQWEQWNLTTPFEISVLMEPARSPPPGITGYALVLIMVIAAVGGLVFFSRTKGRETISYPALVDQEKMVVDLLRKAEDNVMWQKQIQVQSGFSKVKVSRLLQSLEKRGVITKEPWGNTNKIHLVTGPDETGQS